MAATGLAELTIILSMFFGSGFSLPVGMPPAPEDPLMARVAPEQCLFYSTWAGRADLDGDATNSVERLLAEPEVQRAFSIAEREMRRALQQAGRDGDPEQLLVASLLPHGLQLLLTQPGAMFVQEARPSEDTLEVKAGVILRLGELEQRTRQLLNQLRVTLLEGQATSVEVAGHSFHEARPEEDAPLLQWGIANGYLIVGIGEGSAEQMLERGRTDAPAWLTAARAQLKVERPSTFSYVNLQQIKGLIPPAAGFQAEMALNFAGLQNVTHFSSLSGLNERGVVSQSLVGIDGEATGLMAAIEAEPLGPEDLQGIPQDAIFAAAVRLNVGTLYQNVMESLARIQPEMVGQAQRQLRGLEDNLGFRLQEDVFDALGDVWSVHTSASNGGILTGWTFKVDLKDAQKLQRISDRLMGLVAGSFNNQPRAPRIRHLDTAGATIHFVSVPESEFLIAPAWCITDSELLVAMFPQTLAGYLARRSDTSLAETPPVARLMEANGPVALTYLDTRSMVELLYPMLMFGGRAALSEIQRETEMRVDIDISILPSVAAISRHLEPTVASISRVDDGVLLTREQSVPGGSVGATAPIMIALLLPAVQSAREAARRMESTNNLRQFAIAMHNFADTYRGLPAQYNTDEDGKPLLSWRVHILPFIEQSQLYDQFRFDEPWDSDHNKQLIARMPEIFASPNSRFAPTEGKTNYLGLTNEESVLQPPAESQNGVPHPTSIRFADILDGTSNTVMMVEVPDEQAVIWTKPQDLDVDLDNVARGVLSKLTGLRPGGFLAAFTDGSVRFISETVDHETLKALLTRAGGEVVGSF